MTKYNSDVQIKYKNIEETLNAVEEILYAQNNSLYATDGQFDDEEITLTDELMQALQNIEPQSGDTASPESAPVNNAVIQTTVTPGIGSFIAQNLQSAFEDLGPLEETLLDYLARTPNNLNHHADQSLINTINTPSDVTPNIEPTLQPLPVIVEPAPVEPITYDLALRLSNATTHGDTINSSDNYEAHTDLSVEKQRLNGEALDIQSVNADALFFYTIKGNGHINAVLKSDWNSIKNIEINADHHADITIKNFVHSTITLGGDENSTVVIRDAKRGEIETGDGDDKVTIIAKSNGAGWSNSFTIDTNGGADTLILKGDQGHTSFTVDSGDDADVVRISGHYDTSIVNLGSGDDKFAFGSGQDKVFGEAGNDLIKGGKGDDILFGGADSDTIRGGKGDDIINGGEGSDMLYGGKGADRFTWSSDDVDGQSIDSVFGFNAKQGDMLDISDVLQFDSASDDMLADFVRFVDADTGKNATLEIREQGEGDWTSVADIARGAQLDSVENLVDDGTLII